jgi:ubiquinol-cytochrome c reductase iron-sulfur subunit
MTSRRIAVALLVSIAASVGLMVVYATGGGPQLEGALLGLAFGGIGWALVAAAHHFLSTETSEKRTPLASPPADVQEVEGDITGTAASRRRLLMGLGAGSLAALAVALGFPVRSLGGRPGRRLFETAWRAGVRLVDGEGEPVHRDTLPVGAAMTAFPEGSPHAADSIVILVRMATDRLDLPEDRTDWAAEGHIAYSKICTHAGCPVGLFDADNGLLICPCHQSSFVAARGAEPRFGPAARPLPQLPLGFDDDGMLVARGDMSHPVGPGFWGLPGEDEA